MYLLPQTNDEADDRKGEITISPFFMVYAIVIFFVSGSCYSTPVYSTLG